MRSPPNAFPPPNPVEMVFPKPGLFCAPNKPVPVLVKPAEPKRPEPPKDEFVPPKPPRVEPKPVVPGALRPNPGFVAAVLPNKPVDPVEPNVLVPNVFVPELAAPNANGFEVAPNRLPL